MLFTVPLPPEWSLQTRTRLCVLGFIASVLAGCSDQPTAPAEQRASPPASSSSVKFWDAGAAVAWNELATTHAAHRTVNIFRLYAYLSLAQLRAAEAAEAIQPHPPISAAIAGASAVVLASYFPLDVGEIEAALAAQQAAPPWSGAKHADFAAGEAIGRDIGARVVAWSAGDGVGLTDPGVPPVGPGHWVSPGTIARGLLGARPFFLTADDEFRPGPPPAFGSPTFLAALAEVRQIADTRTPEQLASAIFWHLNHSATSQAAMQALARELIVRHRLKDAEAARVLFLANASMFDATIGCFDAKYHYWLIRPPQADPAIVTPFPTPAHPSYPSAHSCISGAITETLARAFPSERDRLEGVAEEASLSRLYAGIHYRFDMVAGLALGRAVAAKLSTLNLDDVAPLP